MGIRGGKVSNADLDGRQSADLVDSSHIYIYIYISTSGKFTFDLKMLLDAVLTVRWLDIVIPPTRGHNLRTT